MASPPNLFSLARLGLTPVAVSSILGQRYGIALVILALAAITDGVDGILARRFGLETRVGALLDPLADKVLVAAVFLSLGAVELVPWWLVGLVFGRDLLILAGSGLVFALAGRREFRPSIWGKISTTIQLVTAVTVIAGETLEWPLLGGLTKPLIAATAAVTIWSGLHYAWQAWKRFLH